MALLLLEQSPVSGQKAQVFVSGGFELGSAPGPCGLRSRGDPAIGASRLTDDSATGRIRPFVIARSAQPATYAFSLFPSRSRK